MEQLEFAKHLRSCMTESETLLWRHLRAHRLNGGKFRRQQPIGPYVVDFVHFGVRLIIEADGGQREAGFQRHRHFDRRAQVHAGGAGNAPILHKEPLEYEFIELKQRSYK